MTQQERAALLRFQTKTNPRPASTGKGLWRTKNPEHSTIKRVRYVVLPKPTGSGYVSLGAMQSITPPKWIQCADSKPRKTTKIKNRWGANALVKIADRYYSPSYRTETKRLEKREACR